ncbi:MAG: hypothetical protein ACREPR_01340 [Brasilonema sp.]
MLGQTICGRYRIIRQIGKGGFGVTFLALDTQREILSVLSSSLSLWLLTLSLYSTQNVCLTRKQRCWKSWETMTKCPKRGKELVFTEKDAEKSLQNRRIFTLKGDQVYVITYTAEIDNYDEFIQTAETMLKSFEIQ